MSLVWPAAAAIGWAVTVAVVGGALTTLGPWYDALKRPKLQPPDWAFGPAWTAIFALAALSAVLAWRDAPDEATRRAVVALFVVNGALNILWNVFFFTLRRPDRALVEVAFLWLSILAPIVVFWPFSPTAALLLLPYLAWVGFASFLNYEIVRLNGPFGSAAKAPDEIDRVRDA
ncbi:MAG: TspO protein [Ancylobacter novellus]|uniref:TspO protein n=1 Tax=Ancylobacter novellus TaxID=921 RepID=A0A2W5KGN9_ANCNO|nr:MAG: TspO protein [Ancylobacter novellus]